MQWLRTFVYEMTGTHTEADNLRDGAIHWFRQLPKKTKRTWKLLSNAFIRYYCSQFTQTALSRYYSAKRERSEHLCDYKSTERLCSECSPAVRKGGRSEGARAAVLRSLHTRVNDIHELEEIIEDVLKGKERMAKRDGVLDTPAAVIPGAMSPMTTVAVTTTEHTEVTLADASLDDLLAELEGREATRAVPSVRMVNITRTKMTKTSTSTISLTMLAATVHWSIMHRANEVKRRAAAEGTYARSDNRQPRGNIPDRERGFIKTVAFGQALVVDVIQPRQPAPTVGRVQSAAHDAGQRELFRNFQDLAKFGALKARRRNFPLSSSLSFKAPFKLGSPPTTTGLTDGSEESSGARRCDDKRTRILLDTGANVSVITDTFAKKLRLRDVPDHGRRIDFQGISERQGVDDSTSAGEITLGWEMVYEFEMWVMAHNFMIPAGIRLDLFHGVAQLPNEIRIPLVKTKNMLDSEEYGSHVNAGPSEQLDIPGHEWREYRLSKRQVALERHILWVRRTEKIIPSVTKFRRGRPQRIKLTNVSDRAVYFPAHDDIAVLVPAGDLPRGDGYVRVDSKKYRDRQVLAYEGCRDRELFQRECERYERWLATQPPLLYASPSSSAGLEWYHKVAKSPFSYSTQASLGRSKSKLVAHNAAVAIKKLPEADIAPKSAWSPSQLVSDPNDGDDEYAVNENDDDLDLTEAELSEQEALVAAISQLPSPWSLPDELLLAASDD
ncbi:Peptidase A2A, retrovirus, catalytic [Phytophthora cactorum]|nr:Peptidase A2A, retrovirus, catalytic [Phytophthora cactorum]